MKKTAAVFLSVILAVLFSLTASAYTFSGSTTYSLPIPASYTQVEKEGTDCMFMAEDGSNFSVIRTANNEKTEPSELDEAGLASYGALIKKNIEESYAKQQIVVTVSVLDVDKERLDNSWTALITEIKSEAADTTLYQKLYQLFGEESIYNLTFTTPVKEKIDSFDDVVEKAMLTEKELKPVSDSAYGGGSIQTPEVTDGDGFDSLEGFGAIAAGVGIGFAIIILVLSLLVPILMVVALVKALGSFKRNKAAVDARFGAGAAAYGAGATPYGAASYGAGATGYAPPAASAGAAQGAPAGAEVRTAPLDTKPAVPCRKCGNEIPRGMNFCPECGAKRESD